MGADGSDRVSGRLSRGRRLAYGGIFLVVLAAIFLGILEVGARIFDPLGISYYPETARWLDTLVVREPTGYWNRPGLRGRYYGADVSINSIGLRGPEIPPKEASEFRILMTGDSFPFGIGVGDDEALPAALESVLEADAPPGIEYRVINLGVVSYNTEQQLRQLRELGLGLRPDLVLLAYAVNDIEPVMWVFEKRRGRLVNLAQRSYAVSLLGFVARSVKFRLFGYSGIALGEYREDSPRWREVEEGLSEMHRLCRDEGVGFAVFVYDDLEEPKALVRALGRREGFPVLELRQETSDRFGGRDPRDLMNSVVDSHPNVEGNRMWAEILANALAESGLLPAPGGIPGRP